MKKIYEQHRLTLVVFVTLISIVMAILLDFILANLLGHTTFQKEDLIRAGLIPLLITPFISWVFIGFFKDLIKLEKKMAKLATFDDLTGLYNRRFFYSLGSQLHQISLRNKKTYAILIIDLDDFKSINDNYGHDCGDRVLESFGFVSKQTARESDILARIGGEEFAFLLPNTDSDQANTFAQRLVEKIKKSTVKCSQKPVQYSVSIGVAVNYCDQEFSMEETLKKADIALYIAKGNGKNMVEMFAT